MTLLNEWTQVYLHGGLPQEWTNNLKGITDALNDGKRTPQQIYSSLKGMGIPTEKCLFAIKYYIDPKAKINLGYYDANKNNQYIMEKFDHKVLAKKIESLIENLKAMVEDDKTKLNYSAQLSTEIAKKYLNEINNISIKLDEINKNNELSEKVKSRTNRSDLTGRSEFYYASRLVSELRSHDWINPVSEFIKDMGIVFEHNRYTAMLSNSIRFLDSERNKSFYESAISDMEFLIQKDENEIKESFKTVLGKYEWIPVVKRMISVHGINENEAVSNSEGSVSKVYSPVIVKEDKSIIFSLDGKLWNLKDNKITEAESSDVDGRFLNTDKALKMFKIVEGKFVLYHGKNVLSIDPENDSIKVNSNVVEQKDLKNFLLKTSFFGLNEMYKLDEIMFFVESSDNVKELDFVTSIRSNNDSRVKVNVIRLDEKIYVNRVNPFMGINEMILAEGASNAQNLVNEYVKFDITNSTIDLLEQEVQKRISLEKEKNIVIEKIKFLEERKKELTNTLGIVGENHQVKKALELIANELKDREIELQNIYSKLGESISEAKKMEDQGYVLGKMKYSDGLFKKNDIVWVYAEDYTTKSERETVKVTDQKGKKVGEVEKKNVEMSM